MPPTVTIEPPGVFIDTGGFVALHVPGDAHHEAAVLCRNQFLRFSRLYTSSAVIAETIAHIQRDHLLDQQNLSELISDFLRPEKWISLLAVDDDVLMKSMQMVKERNDRRFSLVDATNVVLIEKHQIDYIFSYDSFYEGFALRRGYNTYYLQRVGETTAQAQFVDSAAGSTYYMGSVLENCDCVTKSWPKDGCNTPVRSPEGHGFSGAVSASPLRNHQRREYGQVRPFLRLFLSC
jgi:predicted nucleic acid-binding protein